jgi:hypothetical protein
MEGAGMIAVTFDVDDVNWVARSRADEMTTAVPAILSILDAFPAVKTTWFVRLDAGIAERRGRPDALLHDHTDIVARLRAAGHEVAWHHHAVRAGSTHAPETDSTVICNALRALAPCARAWELESVRLGWSYADADILACLDELGFAIDSTALPRPSYPWDNVPRDWDGAPQRPYHPSRDDHRREGGAPGSLLEVPMSVAVLPAPHDTQPDVQRYVNPAYHVEFFEQAIRAVAASPLIVTITHPYECLPTGAEGDAPAPPPGHPLLAHSPEVLRENLAHLQTLGRPFVTLNSLRG